MSRKIEQVNELLKEKLAYYISKEIPMDNGLITVAYVKVTTNLQYARISVSVLPDNMTGTALKQLRKHNKIFSDYLKKETRMRQIPKFFWTADMTEKNAAELEQAINEAIESEETPLR